MTKDSIGQEVNIGDIIYCITKDHAYYRKVQGISPKGYPIVTPYYSSKIVPKAFMGSYFFLVPPSLTPKGIIIS